jgi:hypothetical protein
VGAHRTDHLHSEIRAYRWLRSGCTDWPPNGSSWTFERKAPQEYIGRHSWGSSWTCEGTSGSVAGQVTGAANSAVAGVAPVAALPLAAGTPSDPTYPGMAGNAADGAPPNAPHNPAFVRRD